MTNEEAIKRLKEFKILHTEQHGWDVTTLKALDMAIKALEQQKTGRCKDCKYFEYVILDNHIFIQGGYSRGVCNL